MGEGRGFSAMLGIGQGFWGGGGRNVVCSVGLGGGGGGNAMLWVGFRGGGVAPCCVYGRA